MDDSVRTAMPSPVAPTTVRPKLAATVVATSCGFALIARGAADVFPIFLLPLEAHFGFDRAALTGLFALAMLTTGIAGPLAGHLFDHLGPRWFYASGVASLVAGLVGASQATELWHLQLTLGVCIGFSIASLGSAAQAPLLARWFKGRVGTVLGVVGAAGGIGALIFAPLSQSVIDEAGWRAAYLTLAGLVSLLILPLVLLPWKRMEAGAPAVLEHHSTPASQPAPRVWAARRFLREPLLLAMFSTYLLTCLAAFTIQVLVASYFVECGYSPIAAATTIGLSGLAASVGMVLFGWLSDRIGHLGALTASYAATGLGLAALTAMMWSASPILLAVHVLTFGLAFGSRGPLIFSFVARHFAGPGLGGISGLMLVGFGLGSALGAWLGGALHDLTEGYAAGIMVAALAIALAILPWWLFPRLRRAAA